MLLAYERSVSNGAPERFILHPKSAKKVGTSWALDHSPLQHGSRHLHHATCIMP